LANKVHVKKGDTVVVLSGKDRGKEGKVLSVLSDKSMVLVEGVNIATKHKKPKSAYQQGGIIHQEAHINSSNVMLKCNKCGKATKIGKRILENGEKARVCKKCEQDIDIIRYANNG